MFGGKNGFCELAAPPEKEKGGFGPLAVALHLL